MQELLHRSCTFIFSCLNTLSMRSLCTVAEPGARPGPLPALVGPMFLFIHLDIARALVPGLWSLPWPQLTLGNLMKVDQNLRVRAPNYPLPNQKPPSMHSVVIIEWHIIMFEGVETFSEHVCALECSLLVNIYVRWYYSLYQDGRWMLLLHRIQLIPDKRELFHIMMVTSLHDPTHTSYSIQCAYMKYTPTPTTTPCPPPTPSDLRDCCPFIMTQIHQPYSLISWTFWGIFLLLVVKNALSISVWSFPSSSRILPSSPVNTSESKKMSCLWTSILTKKNMIVAVGFPI